MMYIATLMLSKVQLL